MPVFDTYSFFKDVKGDGLVFLKRDEASVSMSEMLQLILEQVEQM